MIPAGRWIEHLATWLPVARVGEDPEGVHQVRVAARRLDAWLRLGGFGVLRDDLRWLRAEISEARDLDVLLAGELDADFRAWLAPRRDEVHQRVHDAVDHPRTAALIEALSLLPPLDEATARGAIPKVIRQVLRRGRAVDQASADTEALHQLRRGLRRLRFSLEWVGENGKRFVPLQDAFGELNDHAVLLRWLDRAPQDDEHVARRAEAHEALDRRRIDVVQLWRRSEPEVEALLASWTSS